MALIGGAGCINPQPASREYEKAADDEVIFPVMMVYTAYSTEEMALAPFHLPATPYWMWTQCKASSLQVCPQPTHSTAALEKSI